MTLISPVKKSKYLTNRSLHHTTQCLKVPKSSNAQLAKAPMQCVLDTTGAVSMHELPPKVCNQLPTAKNQENLGSTQPFEVWPYSIASHTSHGISGSPLEELKCCCCSGLHTEQSQSYTRLLQPLSQAAPRQHFEIIA